MRKLLALLGTMGLLLAACGGGGGGNIGPPPATNVEPVLIEAGPANTVNTAFVTIKICVPNTATCQTIEHIAVDTGSSGLRILASALTLNLPAETTGGVPIAECLAFADGSIFGPVGTTDLTLPSSGKMAAALPVQVIGAANYPTVPTDCNPPLENDVAKFGANGILGVGLFLQDCGTACADPNNIPPGAYYTCTDPAHCTNGAVPVNLQLANPVAFFSADNNGVVLAMSAVPSGGASSLSGSLIFGIGTQTNNALGNATVLTADVNNQGFIKASYNGTSNLNAAIDSGSNADFFSDSTIPTCNSNPVFFCPNATLNLTATLTGTNSMTATASFSVTNAESFATGLTAIPGLGASIGSFSTTTLEFDLGMPFFFGRNVFTAIESQSTPGGIGPYVAF